MAINPGLYTLTAFLFIFFSNLPYFIVFSGEEYFVNRIPRLNNFIFSAVILLGLYNLIVVTNSAGYTFSDLITIEGVQKIASESTINRYVLDQTSAAGNPIILALSFWLIFRLSINKEKTSKLRISCAFLPLAGYTLLTTEKFALLLGVCFYIVGTVSFDSYKKNIKTIWRNSKYLLLLIPILFLSLGLRGYDYTNMTQAIIQLQSYVFQQYYGLGYWLVEKYTGTSLRFGELTFSGPFDLLGIIDRNPGIYDVSYTVRGFESNIYTAYRNVSEDFSIFAPLVFSGILAVVYYHFIKVRYKTGLVLINIFLLFFVTLSFTTTPFVYNSVLLGIFLCMISVQLQMSNIRRIK